MAKAKGKSQKKRPIKFEFRSQKVTGKNVVVLADGEHAAAVARLTARVKGKPRTVYLSSGPKIPLKEHQEKGEAIFRASRRFPVITARLTKRL